MTNPRMLGLSRRERRALQFRAREIGHLAKLDVFSLQRRERQAQTRTFEQDGVSFTLTLRPPDVADLARAAEVAQRMKEDFITGSEARPACEFPGGVKVSEALFLLAATAAEMQCPENRADRYEPEELIQIADKLPEAWAEAQAWIGSLQRSWEKRRGERPASPGSADQGSADASPSAS
jgi:hypothetical protein